MINQVQLIGRLGKEPEIKTGENYTLATFSLATSENYKDKSGEWQENTTWVNLTCFRPGLVDVIQKYYGKGNVVTVEATYQQREYEKGGEKRFSHEFIIQEIRNLTSAGNKAKENNPEKENDDLPF